MKKMIIFGLILFLVFGLLVFVVNYQKEAEVKEKLSTGVDNPYGTTDLHEATVDQLDNPLYQNQLTLSNLVAKLEENEEVTVYFYSPTCTHCQETTPVIVPLTEELEIDLKKLNLLEYENGWNVFAIEGTPTIVHYENGQEVARISGSQPKENFKAFFDEYVLD